jgi:uncharacterized protein with NRDE domain
MCLIVLAYRSHPDYGLIVGANRDEFYERPTAPASFWEDAPQVLAGRDLRGGGTWLGITREGRFAAVTNYRDSSSARAGAPSRGLLVSEFLKGRSHPAAYLRALAAVADQYNGFSLFVGDSRALYYYSNREGRIRHLAPGLYGLSNHLLDTPWPKVERSKQALAALIRQNTARLPEAILGFLADRAQAADVLLPDTGVGLERERALSPLFISTPIYGTRSSTVLLVGNNGEVTFYERSFTNPPDEWSDAKYRFVIETQR